MYLFPGSLQRQLLLLPQTPSAQKAQFAGSVTTPTAANFPRHFTDFPHLPLAHSSSPGVSLNTNLPSPCSPPFEEPLNSLRINSKLLKQGPCELALPPRPSFPVPATLVSGAHAPDPHQGIFITSSPHAHLPLHQLIHHMAAEMQGSRAWRARA